MRRDLDLTAHFTVLEELRRLAVLRTDCGAREIHLGSIVFVASR